MPELLNTIFLTSPSNTMELFPKSLYSCESFSESKLRPTGQSKLAVVLQMTGCPRLLVLSISTTSLLKSTVLLPRSWYSDSFSVLSWPEQFLSTVVGILVQVPPVWVNPSGHIVGRHSPEGG